MSSKYEAFTYGQSGCVCPNEYENDCCCGLIEKSEVSVGKHTIDYAQVLSHGDIITSAVFAVTPNIVGQSPTIPQHKIDVTNRKIFFSVAGGQAGNNYKMTITVNVESCGINQTIIDCVNIHVKEC